MKKTWNLAPVLQIVQKIPENYCPCLYLPIDQVWWLNMWFKRYNQKCTLSHVLIMTSKIWWITGGLNIQKLEYLENGTYFSTKWKILNMCLRWHIFRSYRFVAEVTFKIWNICAYTNRNYSLLQTIYKFLAWYKVETYIGDTL